MQNQHVVLSPKMLSSCCYFTTSYNLLILSFLDLQLFPDEHLFCSLLASFGMRTIHC